MKAARAPYERCEPLKRPLHPDGCGRTRRLWKDNLQETVPPLSLAHRVCKLKAAVVSCSATTAPLGRHKCEGEHTVACTMQVNAAPPVWHVIMTCIAIRALIKAASLSQLLLVFGNQIRFL